VAVGVLACSSTWTGLVSPPISVAKEAYFCGKRGLFLRQKRPPCTSISLARALSAPPYLVGAVHAPAYALALCSLDILDNSSGDLILSLVAPAVIALAFKVLLPPLALRP